ncbi:hypothetical protein ACFV03_10580 [Streptomyces mirabilis]|uniref:hypothetical protein n=1 Tax=Streptomyces mirabilis TaxID=68239 RepID=UPI003679C88C
MAVELGVDLCGGSGTVAGPVLPIGDMRCLDLADVNTSPVPSSTPANVTEMSRFAGRVFGCAPEDVFRKSSAFHKVIAPRFPSEVFGLFARHNSFSESLSYTSTIFTLSEGQLGILTETREPSIRMPARMVVAGSDML